MIPFLDQGKPQPLLIEERNELGERTDLEHAPPEPVATTLDEVEVDPVDTRPDFDYSTFLRKLIVKRIMESR